MKLLSAIGLFAIAIAILIGDGGCQAAHSSTAQQSDGYAVENYRADAERLIAAALADSSTFDRLAELTDTFGPRLSGSQSLEDALDWIVAELKADGFDAIMEDPVMVPHWVRGRESLALVEPRRADLQILGLGGSIATPAAGIEADVLVVSSFDDLEARAADARGKIVLFNVPFTSYGRTVTYRTNGAVAAAKVGAVA
ncbi:MAG: peptidase M28 family protein, partial [Rhodothermales bacterium]|nr:peptidase M28 family protein [Rhodothermales bacterium]